MTETRCAVVGCNNILVETTCSNDPYVQQIQYHSFPDDPEIERSWMQFAGREESEWDPDFSHICSVHFTDEDYYLPDEIIGHFLDIKILKDTAVPSLLFLESIEENFIDYNADPQSLLQNYKMMMGDDPSESDFNETEDKYESDGDVISLGGQSFDYENDYWKSSKRKISDDYDELKVIACEICNREFSRKLGLEHHLARIHKLSKKKINFYLQKIVHYTSHNYKCDICKKVFYKKEKLDCHICMPAVAVMCEICQQKFTSKTGLKSHLLGAHQLGHIKVDLIMEELADYNSRLYKKFKVDEDILITTSDDRVITKIGDSQFKTAEGPRCFTCNKVLLGESAFNNHACETTIQIFCSNCQYSAPTKYNLKRHLMLKHKLSEADVSSAMDEFNCYKENMQLRREGSGKKSRKKKASKKQNSHKLVIKNPSSPNASDRHEDLCAFNSELLQSVELEKEIDFEEKNSSNSDEECRAVKTCKNKVLRKKPLNHFDSDEDYSPSKTVKTCKKCDKKFESHFLFNEHNCKVKQSSTKQFKTEINTNNKSFRKIICEICQIKFTLRIALKRHLECIHCLDADVIDVLLERTLCDVDNSDSPELNSDIDCKKPKEELLYQKDLVSNSIEPIDCEVCHEKLNSKKDLKGHLLNCFKMEESTINSIFEESKNYYARFYGREDKEYDLVLSSSDGRIVCKKKNSEFILVPGPRCMKCKKAFEDKFKIVGHECATSILITCKTCDYAASTRHKIFRHLVGVHKHDKDDVDGVLEEFNGYSTRLQLRKNNWPLDPTAKKEAVKREILLIRLKNRSSDYFEEAKDSLSEFEMREANKLYEAFEEEDETPPTDCERLLNQVIKQEITSSDNESFNLESPAELESDERDISIRKSRIKCEGPKNLTEMDIRNLACEICHHKFYTRIELKKHQLNKEAIDYYLKRIPPTSAQFKCNICKKQFNEESKLALHDCTAAIAVLCELCQQVLISKAGLKRHLLCVHKIRENKVFSIMEELSGFNSKFHRKFYIEDGELAIYSSDGRTIRKKKGFKLEMYSGPRCKICFKAFINGETKSTHKCVPKIEIGCELCKYKATSKYNLKGHLVFAHKVKHGEAKLVMLEFNRYNKNLVLR